VQITFIGTAKQIANLRCRWLGQQRRKEGREEEERRQRRECSEGKAQKERASREEGKHNCNQEIKKSMKTKAKK
jgi:hypothetical protein